MTSIPLTMTLSLMSILALSLLQARCRTPFSRPARLSMA
jgi:hypothetical protein